MRVLGLLLGSLVATATGLNIAPVARRAVLSGAAAALVSPLPAFARSKEKAKEKAMQKATAGEVRQAMKEYKYAPRPELVGNAQTGYSFKDGTTGGASQGELSSYFKDKGAKIQADFNADKARASGASEIEAKKLADKLEREAIESRKAAYLAKKNTKSFDEQAIAEFCKTAAGKAAVDNVGRPMCR